MLVNNNLMKYNALPYCLAILISFVFGIFVNQTLSSRVVEKVHAEVIEVVKEETPLLSFNEQKLKELMTTNHWSHGNADGCDYLCRFSRHPFKAYEAVSENLYRGPCNMLTAFEAWKASPAHLEVLNYSFDEVIMTGEVNENGECYLVLNLSSI